MNMVDVFSDDYRDQGLGGYGDVNMNDSLQVDHLSGNDHELTDAELFPGKKTNAYLLP